MSPDLKKESILFDRWKIIEPLGEGTLGKVYKAYDPVLGRYVAIKQLRPEIASDIEAIKRFEDELRTIGGLKHHPGIITLYDFRRDLESGDCFSIMEYVEEGSLRKYMEAESISVIQSLDIVIDICDPLEVVHRWNIIHCDLKPDNILLDKEEDKVIPKICDFGATASRRTARTGYHTYLYASPEELSWGEVDIDRVVDIRSDLYSLGVILYEMLTGAIPFPFAGDLNAWLVVVLREEPTPPSHKRAGISSFVDKVVLRALQKAPNDRYQAAREMAEALKQAKQAQQEWEVAIKESYRKAEHHLDKEEWQEAAKLYEGISKQNPADLEAPKAVQYAQGMVDLFERRWGQAVESLQKVVKIDPDYRDAAERLKQAHDHLKMANLYHEVLVLEAEEAWDQVIELLEKIILIAPRYEDAAEKLDNAREQKERQQLYEEAESLLESRQWDEAVRKYDKIIARAGPTKDVIIKLEKAKRQKQLRDLYQQGMAHFNAKDWDKAIAFLEELVELHPCYQDAIVTLTEAKRCKKLRDLYREAELLLERKEWQLAIEKLDEILLVDVNYRDSATKLREAGAQFKLESSDRKAKENEKNGQWLEAVRTYVEIQDLDPTYCDVFNRIKVAARWVRAQFLCAEGGKLRASGQLEEAAKRFQEAFDLEPDFKEAGKELDKIKRLLTEPPRPKFPFGNPVLSSQRGLLSAIAFEILIGLALNGIANYFQMDTLERFLLVLVLLLISVGFFIILGFSTKET